MGVLISDSLVGVVSTSGALGSVCRWSLGGRMTDRPL
jgi:hypothetical protein